MGKEEMSWGKGVWGRSAGRSRRLQLPQLRNPVNAFHPTPAWIILW